MLFRLGFHSLGLILTNNTTNLCSGIKRGQKRSDELREQIHWKFRVFTATLEKHTDKTRGQLAADACGRASRVTLTEYEKIPKRL